MCHLVIARIAPDVRVVDLSHGVPPHDIQAGAMMLANGMAHAGPYAVALGIVDPGVGTARRAIAVRTADGPRLVGPDNGLLSLAWRALGGVTHAVEIDPAATGATTVSAVFHGRDVFAPAAAHLAAGMPLEQLGAAVDPSILQTLELEDAESEPGRIHGSVVDVDRFGNIRLSARPGRPGAGGLPASGRWSRSRRPRPRSAPGASSRTATSSPGEYGMLVDAWDWVSVIRYEASAAAGMGVTRGRPGLDRRRIERRRS